MLARAESTATIVENWLAQFARAVASPDHGLLETLFHPASHWRDVLALTWQIRTVNGSDAILSELKVHVGRANPTGFEIDPDRTAPRSITRAGTQTIEGIFRFKTADGRGCGVVRLTPDANEPNTLKAWTLFTALDELKGYEEQVGRLRPNGETYARDFHGPNWLDRRKSAAAYTDRDPAVLVLAGTLLSIARPSNCRSTR